MVPVPEGATLDSLSVSLPDASLAQCDAAEVTYRRNFNRPTGLESGSCVWLNSALLPLARSVELNGHSLTPLDSDRVEITSLLRPHNELLVSLQREAYLAASQAAASLQIIEPA